MDINTLLSDLVVIADSLDRQNQPDIAADIDAAIFILSSESAQPLNKSMASLTREHYAALAQGLSQRQLDDDAAAVVQEIMTLTGELLDLEGRSRLAILKTVAQSMRSALSPGKTLAHSSVAQGSELLAEAEKKLSERDELQGLGHRVGVIRANLESDDG